MNLEPVLTAKQQALAARKAKTPIEAIRALASMQKRPQPVLSTITNGAHTVLLGQVRHPVDDAPYDPAAVALRLAQAGVDALALFTDSMVYDGGLNDLTRVARSVNAPIISQDYIFDEYQIVEARAAGASGLTLYADLLDTTTLRKLVSATQRNRMTAIVQVANADALAEILDISPQVIAVHPGDRLIADKLCPLCSRIPSHIRTCVAQPLTSLEEVKAVAALRPDAVVVSEVLLDQPETIAQVRQLLHQA